MNFVNNEFSSSENSLSKIDFDEIMKMRTRIYIVHNVDRRFESITLWYFINLILKLNSPTIFVFSAKFFESSI